MSPRRRRGRSRDALFTWTPDAGDIQPSEVRDNPRTRRCQACKANPGEPCTRPGRGHGGRVPIDGYHDSRLNPPTPVDQQPPENPPSAPAHAPGATPE